MGNVSSLPSGLQPQLLPVIQARVSFHTPTGNDYSGGVSDANWNHLPKSVVSRITHVLGPEPSSCEIRVPVRNDLDLYGLYPAAVGQARARSEELSAIGPYLRGLKLMSKIRVQPLFRTRGSRQGLDSLGRGARLFVGYVTRIREVMDGDSKLSEIVIEAKDGRELLRKTPVQGKLFFNPDFDTSGVGTPAVYGGDVVYIRDHRIVFNEGMRPNKFRSDDLVATRDRPRFVNLDLNRFINDPNDTDNKNVYAPDTFFTDPAYRDFIDQPYAEKWLPGHAWNYVRNLLDATLWTAATGRIYTIPQNAITEDNLPPMWVLSGAANTAYGGEMVIPVLDDAGTDAAFYKDFFSPRAIVGQAFQAGAGTAVSGLGELVATGMPMNEFFFELCRRVGNYTLAAYYDSRDRMVLIPIRSVQALAENSTLPVGLKGRRGGGGGGKAVTIGIPGRSGSRPNVSLFDVSSSTDAYYNRFHYHAGLRFVQCTFTTVGRQNWTDHLSMRHERYRYTTQQNADGGPVPDGQGAGGVPVGEWLPALTTPTLVPAWALADQTSLLTLFSDTEDHGALERYIDVFTTWIVPQDGTYKIDWTDFFGGLSNTPGFRRFFDRDREALDRLVVKVFQLTSGLFRNRAINPPVMAMRAFRGKRLDAGGNTAYGGAATENDPLRGYSDWSRVRSTYELLTDGRLGVRFALDARNNLNYNFQGTDPPLGTVDSSPEAWNGSVSNPRAYEIMATFPIALDEDLWEQVDNPAHTAQVSAYSARRVTRHGPLMELFRDGGQEYNQEWAYHSLMQRHNPSETDNVMLAVPPTSNGIDDDAIRIYNDGAAEVRARVRMMANRNAAADNLANVTLPFICLALMAGDYIDHLERVGDRPDEHIPIGSLVSAITWDFQNQITQIRLETYR